MMMPFASLTELVSRCPYFRPDELADTQQALGVAENLTAMDSNAVLDRPLGDVSFLLIVLQHTLSTFAFLLVYLKHRCGLDRSPQAAIKEAEKFFVALLNDLSDLVAAHTADLGHIFAGLLRHHPTVESAAAELAKRLMAWQYPAHDSEELGPLIPPDLATYPTAVAQLVTPSLALVFDLLGGMASQLAYGLFQSVTATTDRYTQDATLLARKAIDAQGNCDPHCDLHKRLRAFSAVQGQAMPRNDGYDGHFNVWRIRSRAAGLAYAACIYLRFLATALFAAYDLQADACPEPKYQDLSVRVRSHLQAVHSLNRYRPGRLWPCFAHPHCRH